MLAGTDVNLRGGQLVVSRDRCKLKRRPTPLKKNFDFSGGAFLTYTRVCPGRSTSQHRTVGRVQGKTANFKRLVGNNFGLVGKFLH